MRLNNYIKVLSAVLIVFGYSNCVYSSQIDQSNNHNAYNNFVQKLANGDTKATNKITEENDYINEYNRKMEKLSNILTPYIEFITQQMNKTFHMGTFSDLNNAVLVFLNTFNEDLCNSISLTQCAEGLYALNEIFSHYNNACEQQLLGKTSKYFSYNKANKANLEILLQIMKDLNDKMYSEFRKLFPESQMSSAMG